MPSLKYEGNFAVLRMCSLFFLPIPAISSPHCSSCSHLPICTARHQARNLAAGKLHRSIVEVQVKSPFHALSCSLRKLDFDKIKFCLLFFSKFYLVFFFFLAEVNFLFWPFLISLSGEVCSWNILNKKSSNHSSPRSWVLLWSRTSASSSEGRHHLARCLALAQDWNHFHCYPSFKVEKSNAEISSLHLFTMIQYYLSVRVPFIVGFLWECFVIYLCAIVIL